VCARKAQVGGRNGTPLLVCNNLSGTHKAASNQSSGFSHIRFTGRICFGRKTQNFATTHFQFSGVATDDK